MKKYNTVKVANCERHMLRGLVYAQFKDINSAFIQATIYNLSMQNKCECRVEVREDAL